METLRRLGGGGAEETSNVEREGNNHSNTKVNIFDVVAVGETKKLILPLLLELLNTFSIPIDTQRIEIAFDFFDFCCEVAALKLWNASIFEHYFGMVRSKDSKGSFGWTYILVSAIDCSLLPIFEKSLKYTMDQMEARGLAYKQSVHPKKIHGKIARYTHKSLHMLNAIIKTIFTFYPKFTASSLLQLITGIRLEYDQREAGSKASNFLSFFIILLRFWGWWKVEGRKGALRKRSDFINVPPPPNDFPQKDKTSAFTDRVDGSCCICSKSPSNQSLDMACIPSGRLFCVPCITDWITIHKTCPITKIPTKLSQIRPIFI